MADFLNGLIAAPFSPFHSNGNLNLAQVEKLAGSLRENEVKGAFVCGSTGEGVSLTLTERMALAQEWQRVAGPKLNVLVHVGHLSLEDARTLAAHAQRIGVRAIAAMAPFYYQAPTPADLVAFFADITTAAPEIPFYYYHIPGMTGVKFRGIEFLRAAHNRLPTLAGIKFTHEDLMDFGECLDFEAGKYNMLFGRDEILLAGLALGAHGAVGSTYNFAMPYYQRIINTFEKGDLNAARQAQSAVRDFLDVILPAGGQAALKAVMGMIGLDCGPVRLPMHTLTTVEYDQLETRLKALGFFDKLQPYSASVQL